MTKICTSQVWPVIRASNVCSTMIRCNTDEVHQYFQNRLAGRTGRLRGPHAARGPRVWHPCFKRPNSLLNFCSILSKFARCLELVISWSYLKRLLLNTALEISTSYYYSFKQVALTFFTYNPLLRYVKNIKFYYI